jgi:small-conductance mechanosensitive channel
MLLWVFAPTAAGQISLPGVTGAQKVEPAATLPIAEEKALATAQLAKTELQREQAKAVATETRSEDLLHANEHKLLLDRLASLQRDKLKRLEDIATRQQATKPSIDANPLVQQLGQTPPYSALHVDALRDEYDGLREKLQTLQLGVMARESEKQQKQEQLQKANEAERLAADRVNAARGQAASEDARRQQEIALLRKQVAEAELALLAVEQDWLRLQGSLLKEQIDALNTVISGALPAQRLSEGELEHQRQRMNGLREVLTAEIERATKLHQRHRAERDRLDREPGGAEDMANVQRRKRLDQTLETDNDLLQGLRGLQLLAEVTTDAWESRYVVLSTTDAEKRRLALQSMEKMHAGLANRKRLSQEMRDVTRAAIREHENRIANLQAGSPELEHERALLALLHKRADIHDRVEQAASRLERQLARWLGDFSAGEKQSLAKQAATWGDQSRQWLSQIWKYELFAVEDVSEVDGRRVTVSYGVTVGKSVGALLLFLCGYWLFSRLVRKLQDVLVRRFGIDPQVAQVIRRWAMILLAAMLLIFVLNLARIPLTVFAFLGGALAIGVGFGTQTIIKNFISGIIILFERKIRVGDTIELQGMTGQVTAVDLRATTVRGFNGVEALVPNSSFLENQVINWTYSNQQIRREIRVGAAYGSDTRQAEALLLAEANRNPEVLREPPPEVFFDDFADSSLLLVLVYWVELGPSRMARRIDSELRHAIYRTLNAAGISIAFPQSDVHIDMREPLRVELQRQRPNIPGEVDTQRQ